MPIIITGLDCYTGAKVPELQACCTGGHTSFGTMPQGSFNTSRPAIASQLWANITGPTIAYCDMDDTGVAETMALCFAGKVGMDKKWLQCQPKVKNGGRKRAHATWGLLGVVALLASAVVL
ncbi:hypothetical protein Q8F55_007269 [Vanrija albida]|uniref:Uncharacterized protein n=1 Tax=Vanrija albida TaxID=181172 RepID=A0ABR3PZM6_9TREE